MLTEHFIASTCSAQAAKDAGIATTTQSAQPAKDEGIFIHTFQPPQPGPQTAFKKSTALPKCVAVSASHVYSAQSGNSIVHVYKLENGVLEAVVPFPARIACIELALGGTLLAVGLQGGEVILWETLTGRVTTVPHTHLQRVTALSASRHHLLSGSADTTIHIWALVDILSPSASNAGYSSDIPTPRSSLTHHRAPITAITTSSTPASTPCTTIAISGSEDAVAIIWDVGSGTALRTFLLAGLPTSLVLDPAERAAYACLEGGDVQMLDFYREVSRKGSAGTKVRQENTSNEDLRGGFSIKLESIRSNADSDADTPIQPSSSSVWPATNQNLGCALDIALSWDATTLLTGHSNGAIARWDVGRGCFSGVACKLNGPVTNLAFLSPSGFPGTESSPVSVNGPSSSAVAKPNFKQHAVTRPVHSTATGSMSGLSQGAQAFQKVSFPNPLSTPRFPPTALSGPDSTLFSTSLTAVMFPDEILDEGIAELSALRERKRLGHSSVVEKEEDIIMLEGSDDLAQARKGGAGAVRELTLEEQNTQLRTQVHSLQRTLGKTFEEMRNRGWGVGLRADMSVQGHATRRENGEDSWESSDVE